MKFYGLLSIGLGEKVFFVQHQVKKVQNYRLDEGGKKFKLSGLTLDGTKGNDL